MKMASFKALIGNVELKLNKELILTFSSAVDGFKALIGNVEHTV